MANQTQGKKKRSAGQIIIDIVIILVVIALLAVAGAIAYHELFPNNEPLLRITSGGGTNWEELKKTNPQTVGWLKIDGTNIDTPVVQTTDNDYYLNYNFYNQVDERGTVVLDADFKWEPRSRNAVLYGHSVFNQNSGIHVMFDDLHNYADDPNFYAGHKIIHYNLTPERGGDADYEIFSILRVESWMDYRRPDFANEAEFMAYYDNIRSHSVIDTGVQVQPGDQIVTLSTCTEEVEFEDGRLAIVARRLTN